MSEFTVKGMKCQSCIGKITDALLEAGYKNVFVSLDPPVLRLESDGTISKEDVQEKLAAAGDYKLEHHDHQAEREESLTPLFIILAYVFGGSLLRALLSGDMALTTMMTNFMGGFLVVFSLFKLLDLNGFAEAFATYDIVAIRSRTYALCYPFIELVLGIAYFIGYLPMITNVATLTIMVIGSLGVYLALRSNRHFQCACLGTALKLPMTKVTLAEDLVMGAMALFMLLR